MVSERFNTHHENTSALKIKIRQCSLMFIFRVSKMLKEGKVVSNNIMYAITDMALRSFSLSH